MARLRLRTQLLIASLLIISGLTAALLFIVRRTVRLEIAEQLRQSTAASLKALESVRAQHELELSRTAALLAQLPTLKALMTTQDAPTIQDASEPLWRLAGSDLFVLASPARKILGVHLAPPGANPVIVENNLSNSLDRGEDSAWWYTEGRLYWVFLRPITAGVKDKQRELGVLAIGYQADSSLAKQLATAAGSQIVLTAGTRVIASTIEPNADAQLSELIASGHLRAESAARVTTLGHNQFQIASVPIDDASGAPVTCYVLVSLERSNSFVQRLNRIIFILAASALILAAILLSLVSRTITQPLENLVAAVRALSKGDYRYSVTHRGSSEVIELGESFSKMRADLLALQQRQLAAERVAALGQAASSISHDLRHYLAAVVANAEFLYESERLRIDRGEIYDEIKSASNQILELLDSLREVAKEGPAISPEMADMEKTARRAADAVQASSSFSNFSISIETFGSMQGVFDAKRIERVFLNLLLNACEATSDRAGHVAIEIRASKNSFDIRIADNGPGIPAAIRRNLFDPFVSFGKSNGTGLGLAIVAKIVHDHNGSVEIEKTSREGTVFCLRLPRRVDTGKPQIVSAVS